MQIKLFIYHRLPVIIYCAVIFYFSSQPAPDTIPDFPQIDKFFHLLIYAICGALFLRAFRTFSIADNQKEEIPFGISEYDLSLVKAGGWVDYADTHY